MTDYLIITTYSSCLHRCTFRYSFSIAETQEYCPVSKNQKKESTQSEIALLFGRYGHTYHNIPKLDENGTLYRSGIYLKLMICTNGHLKIRN